MNKLEEQVIYEAIMAMNHHRYMIENGYWSESDTPDLYNVVENLLKKRTASYYAPGQRQHRKFMARSEKLIADLERFNNKTEKLLARRAALLARSATL